MTYLASADLLAVRSLAAEPAFSLDHRVDLPLKTSTSASEVGNSIGSEGSRRARTFYSGLTQRSSAQHTPGGTATTAGPRTLTLVPEPGHSARAGAVDEHTADPARFTPKGKHHRPEPADEEAGFTLIDLRDQDTGFRIRTEPDHQRGPGALAVVIELDDYRTPENPPPTTPPPVEAGPMRRRSRRVRGYVRGLEPDERAEFATLRNTIRAYLRQKEELVA